MIKHSQQLPENCSPKQECGAEGIHNIITCTSVHEITSFSTFLLLKSYRDLHLAIRNPVGTVQVFPWGRKCPKPIPRSNCKDEDYFMAMACLASQRSKDPARQV